MDKAFWQSIRENHFTLPAGRSPADLTHQLLPLLGSTDPELRDQLAYSIIATWIEWNLFSPAELQAIAEQMRNNLQSGLGERETDTVFLRAFSILILTEIVALDATKGVLTEAQLRELMDAGLVYFEAEQDWRGYVPEKGWAHSVAHTADFLRALAGHPALGPADLLRLLAAIAVKVTTPTPYPFLAEEEDRLALAVLALLRRDRMNVQAVAGWLQTVADMAPERTQFVAGEGAVAHHNTKALLTSLCALLACHEPARAAELLPHVQRALRRLAPWW